jgi:hypothetical protein
MKAGMKAGYTSPSAAASVSNLDQGQLSPTALALSCDWLSSASIHLQTLSDPGLTWMALQPRMSAM